MRLVGLAVVAVAVLFAGCSAGELSSTVVPGDLTSPVEGVVVDVEAAGLTDVSAFVVRLSDGAEVSFDVGQLENGVEFPPSHLAVHLADAQPVRVFFRPGDGSLVAYRLEDATATAS